MIFEGDRIAPHTLRYSSLEPVDFSGFVYKKGKMTKMKQRRLLCLQVQILSLYRRQGGQLVWEIDPRECAAVKVDDEECGFEVRCGDKVFSFLADTKAECTMWLHKLELASRVSTPPDNTGRNLTRRTSLSRWQAVTKYYQLGKTIGKGSFAEVVIGSDRATAEVFAVKVITKSGEGRDREQQMETMRREISILTAVDHPNVVKTIDVFQTRAHVYLVMEFMGGGELFDIIAEEKTFTELNAMQVMREILLGVAYLHEQGIVHRDIKPENILCVKKTWPLQVKVCDFGLANVIGSEKILTSLVGTCVYRAPEVVRHLGHGPAVDLWACGVVLYVMLFGLFPFYGVTDQEYLDEIDQGLQYPVGHEQDISPECAHVVEGLLRVDPTFRLTAKDALRQPWFNPETTQKRGNSLKGIQRRLIHSAKRSDLSSILNSPRSSCTIASSP